MIRYRAGLAGLATCLAVVIVASTTEVLDSIGLRSAGMGAPGVLTELTQPRGHRNGTTPVEPGPFGDNPPYLGPSGPHQGGPYALGWVDEQRGDRRHLAQRLQHDVVGGFDAGPHG